MALIPVSERLSFPMTTHALHAVVRAALDEDGAFNDVTTMATVPADRRSRGAIVARAKGVVCGMPLAVEAFRLLDPRVTIHVEHDDGAHVEAGTQVLLVDGNARGLLSAERVALNYLQRLSGVATLTAAYVAAVAGTSATILDTRKTTPGWRALEKYAVRAGGGSNYRMDLTSAVLIKDNHLAAMDGDVAKAVQRARELAPAGVPIEVECDRIDQVDAALGAGVEIILLDNMSLDDMSACVRRTAGRAKLEESGGVTLTSVRAIADTGVDFISVGALTHSAPALDLGLDFA
ncbi:MAG TPA: carboxylating nicotinate-nucleotide diphosphorylase [Polyangiales bacterium]